MKTTTARPQRLGSRSHRDRGWWDMRAAESHTGRFLRGHLSRSNGHNL
ncbi:MAG: hypothetical protein WBP93_00060 [Pyrinomonadaceae bacterium]